MSLTRREIRLGSRRVWLNGSAHNALLGLLLLLGSFAVSLQIVCLVIAGLFILGSASQLFSSFYYPEKYLPTPVFLEEDQIAKRIVAHRWAGGVYGMAALAWILTGALDVI